MTQRNFVWSAASSLDGAAGPCKDQLVTATYSIPEGELVVSDEETGDTTWRGRLDDCDATDVLSLLDGDAIVLLDYRCGERRMRLFRNVLQVRPDGEVTWRAEARHHDDPYTSVRWRDESCGRPRGTDGGFSSIPRAA